MFEWLLPTFDKSGFYDFIAARMQNYKIHIIRNDASKPAHFDTFNEKFISVDYVARFFGCQLVQAIKSLPSVDNCWSTRKALDAVGIAKESMPCGAFSDMQRCIHFADDWEEKEGDVWNDYFTDVKVKSPSEVAHHCCKFAIIEDAFNKRWKEAMIFRWQLTMDESQTTGWYHGPITQGPEPKPVHTGATMHTVCVTDGPLATYKLHAWMFGGKTDGDLQSCHINTITMQKWMNMMLVLLDDFKGKGRCITMDSACMGDIMAQIGRNEWKLNMVGTSQSNQMGTNVKDVAEKMKPRTYKPCFWQHNTKNLVYAAWSDNAVVKTLSNHHCANVLVAGGLMWRRKDNSGLRTMHQTPVPCLAQMKEYSKTFHFIDKGNGKEVKYDMAGKSWKHNWSPKLVFRMFNMTLNNAYVVYKELASREGNGRDCFNMGKVVRELAHGLCQWGEPIQKYATTHPVHLQDMDQVDGFMVETKF